MLIKCNQEKVEFVTESIRSDIYDEFLFNTTSHLLKPLNEILASSIELLRDEELLGDKQKQHLLRMQSKGYRLLELVNDVRDYAEIQTGRIIIEKQPTDLVELLENTLGIVRQWLAKDKPQIRLEKDIPNTLPEISIHGVRIQQVIFNIAHNAMKFTEKGFIRVSAIHKDNQVIIQVEDTGIGIAPDKSKLVFEPFQTAYQDKTDSRVGLGLGLPISKYVVEVHAGKIWFESKEGEGSSFYFSLPVEQTR
jgi:signal transduction histidine kinase